MTAKRLRLLVLIVSLAGTGCGDRETIEEPPPPPPPPSHPPSVLLAYTADRSHAPASGFLQAIAEDPDGDLATATLTGPAMDRQQSISGETESFGTDIVDLPAGDHVFIATATDHAGHTHADTLTIRVLSNHPPPSKLTATGDGPWWRLTQHIAVDPQGDPVQYALAVEGPISFTVGPRDTPVDTTVTLVTGRYHVSSVTTDGHLGDSTAVAVDVLVAPPTASQSVEQVGASLRYRASVSAAHATLTAVRAPDDVLYHGTVPLDTTFTSLTPGASSGLPKGDYFFRLYGERHGHRFDETMWGHIVELPPAVDLHDIDVSLHEGATMVVSLPQPEDPNREDRPAYTRATSLDGKVTAVLSDSTLTLAAVADSTGPFRVELVVGDATTGVLIDTLAATIHAAPAVVDTVSFKSGYDTLAMDGGPTSVGSDLATDDESKHPLIDLNLSKRVFAPYYRLKRNLKDRFGIAFGMDYSFLNQQSSFSTTDRQAASHIFRAYGTVKVYGREGVNGGGIVGRVEYRNIVGSGLTPRDLGFDGGSTLSTPTFNDLGWASTLMYWRQWFLQGRVKLLVGNMDPGNFSDVYSLLTAYKAYLSDAFFNNRTVSLPNQGLGIVLQYTPGAARQRVSMEGVVDSGSSDTGFYVAGGLHDANADPTRLGLDTFFEVRQYYTWIEGGWSPGARILGGQGVHVNLWHTDPQESEGTPETWGGTVSANMVYGNRWSPFVRAGYTEGDGIQQVRFIVAGGVGMLVRKSDFIGLATSWSGPLESSLRNQVTSELLYRAQLTQHVAVSPGIQFTVNPSQTLETDYLWVASVLRVRLTL